MTDGDLLNATRTLSVLINALPDATLSFLTQPTNTFAGQVISSPTGVQVRPLQGATPVQGLNITMSIGNNPIGGTLFGIAKVATDANGIASFPFLRINSVGNGYTLIAAANASFPAISNAFDNTIPPGSTLSFTGTMPIGFVADLTIPTPVTVMAQDITSTPLPGVTVTLATGINPHGAILSGNLTAITNASGIATFNNFTQNRGGYGYTLSATAGGIPAASSPLFNVEGFAPAGNVNIKRASHTATLLANGMVLLAGGSSGGGTATAELYDPITGTYTPTGGDMGAKRYQHKATLLPNGKVLIAGGYDDTLPGGPDSLASAELYDPATGAFTATSSMSVERFRPTATLLPNGKVLIAGGAHYTGGGAGVALNSGEVYEPATGSFTLVGNTMSNLRDGATATLLPNGKVLMTGGPQGVSSADLYDPATNSFAQTGSMTIDRAIHTATLLANGQGANNGRTKAQCRTFTLTSAEIYDPATGLFTATGNMIEARQRHAATLLPNGTVMVTGGIGLQSPASPMAGEIYDPVTGLFRASDDMDSPRVFVNSSTLLPNGRVLIAGGNNANSNLSTELFYPLDPPFPTAAFNVAPDLGTSRSL